MGCDGQAMVGGWGEPVGCGGGARRGLLACVQLPVPVAWQMFQAGGINSVRLKQIWFRQARRGGAGDQPDRRGTGEAEVSWQETGREEGKGGEELTGWWRSRAAHCSV